MFRRTSKAQLVPRRKLKRQTPPPAKPRDAGFFGVVENTTVATLAYARRFLRTCVDVSIHPRRLGRLLASRSESLDVVGPYSFIVITGFYAVKLLRIALIFFFLLPIAIFKSCESETTEDIRWPDLSQLLVPPSIVDLVSVGVPIIAASLGIAWMVEKVLARSTPRNRQFYVQAASYSFGLGFLLLLPLCLFEAGWAYSFSEEAPKAVQLLRGDIDSVVYGIVGVVLAMVVWVAACFFGVVAGAFEATPDFMSSRRKKLVVAGTALAGALIMFAVTFLLAYPAADRDFERNFRPKPLFNVQSLGGVEVREGAQLVLAIFSNTNETFQFRAEKVRVYAPGNKEYAARVVRMPGGDPAAPTFRVPARESSWMVVDVLQVQDRTSMQQEAQPRICLYTPSGRPVCAYIRAARDAPPSPSG